MSVERKAICALISAVAVLAWRCRELRIRIENLSLAYDVHRSDDKRHNGETFLRKVMSA